jgi:hypothetical protein
MFDKNDLHFYLYIQRTLDKSDLSGVRNSESELNCPSYTGTRTLVF